MTIISLRAMHSIKAMWIVVGGIIVLGLFLTGYGLGVAKIGQLISKTSADYKAGYDAGREEARSIIANSGLFPPAPSEIKSVSGTVKSIDGNKIVITGTWRISANPLDPQGPDERTVNVTDKTKITAIIPLSPAEMKAAIKVANNTPKNGVADLPPSPFVQKTVTLNDIKLTMTITVTADKDIAQASAFDAESISFTVLPSTVSL